ncbi:MFS transporter [Litorisediminicola beolgyonensis]|uniref:MFS transporter n=2 Tax=Litorisediminicola beolgyonensis TaxID=1173614 RepID=A0ABW3ZHR6_9RHOB
MLSMVVILAVTVSIFAAVTLRAFDRSTQPELRQRTELLGTMLRDDLQRALEFGIPITAMAGLDEKVETLVATFPEIQHVEVRSQSGEVLLDLAVLNREIPQSPWLGFRSWTDTIPVLLGNEIAAVMTIHGNPRLLEARTFRVLIDIGLIALAIVLLGTEVILALAARSIWLPREALIRLLDEQRRGRFRAVIAVPGDGPLSRLVEQLNDRAWHLAKDREDIARLEVSLPVTARLPVFLLAFGTETTASFLPLMAKSAEYPAQLPETFAAAAPLVLYLAAAAVMAPFAGPFVRRVGPRRAFGWAMVPVTLGLVLMAVSSGLTALALGRMVVGAGYTVALVACSAFALRAGGRQMATRTQATQNTALFGGILAGTVVGGIAAFEAGYASAILLGAVAILAAFPVSRWALSGPAGQPRAPRSASGRKPQLHAYAMLVGCIAIPTSAITAVVIWYLMPLLLARTGYDTAMIGRIIMLYYLPTILVAPLAAEIVARQRLSERMAVIAGALVVAGALLSASALSLSPIFLVVILGVGHALIRAPLYALVVAAAGAHAEWIDRYRMAERLGAIAAFLLALVFFEAATPGPILTAFGALSLSAMGVFAMFGAGRRTDEAVEF